MPISYGADKCVAAEGHHFQHLWSRLVNNMNTVILIADYGDFRRSNSPEVLTPGPLVAECHIECHKPLCIMQLHPIFNHRAMNRQWNLSLAHTQHTCQLCISTWLLRNLEVYYHPNINTDTFNNNKHKSMIY